MFRALIPGFSVFRVQGTRAGKHHNGAAAHHNNKNTSGLKVILGITA